MSRIPDYKLKTDCKLGEPDCCRYVALGGDGFRCEKHGSLKVVIDESVKQGTMRAVGDNCDGLRGDEVMYDEVVYRPPGRKERKEVEPLIPPKKT